MQERRERSISVGTRFSLRASTLLTREEIEAYKERARRQFEEGSDCDGDFGIEAYQDREFEEDIDQAGTSEPRDFPSLAKSSPTRFSKTASTVLTPEEIRAYKARAIKRFEEDSDSSENLSEPMSSSAGDLSLSALVRTKTKKKGVFGLNLMRPPSPVRPQSPSANRARKAKRGSVKMVTTAFSADPSPAPVRPRSPSANHARKANKAKRGSVKIVARVLSADRSSSTLKKIHDESGATSGDRLTEYSASERRVSDGPYGDFHLDVSDSSEFWKSEESLLSVDISLGRSQASEEVIQYACKKERKSLRFSSADLLSTFDRVVLDGVGSRAMRSGSLSEDAGYRR